MSSVDTYSLVLNIDYETASLDEVREAIELQLKGLDEAAQKEFLDEIGDEMASMREYIEQLKSDTKNLLRGSSDNRVQLSESDIDEGNEILNELNDLLEKFHDINEEKANAVKYVANLDIETSEDYNFSYDSADWDSIADGDTVTINANGQSGEGLFSEWDSEKYVGMVDTNADGIPDTRVDANQDGVADFDVNHDLVIDEKDILAAQPAARDPSVGQNIFIDINAGDQLTLASYEASSHTATFRITREDGTSFLLKIKGNANLKFYGSNYLDVQKMSDTWPTELKERCWDGSDFVSFAGHTDDVNETTETINAADSTEGIEIESDETSTQPLVKNGKGRKTTNTQQNLSSVSIRIEDYLRGMESIKTFSTNIDVFDGISGKEMKASVQQLMDVISEGGTAEGIVNEITNRFKSYNKKWNDNVAAAFIYALSIADLQVLNQLLAVPGFKDLMRSYVDNGKNKPDYYTEAMGLL